jgi:hypothetical protein
MQEIGIARLHRHRPDALLHGLGDAPFAGVAARVASAALALGRTVACLHPF